MFDTYYGSNTIRELSSNSNTITTHLLPKCKVGDDNCGNGKESSYLSLTTRIISLTSQSHAIGTNEDIEIVELDAIAIAGDERMKIAKATNPPAARGGIAVGCVRDSCLD